MLKVLILTAQLQVSPSVVLLCLPDCVMPPASERLYSESNPQNTIKKIKKKSGWPKKKRGGEKIKRLNGGPWINAK